jgi:hypothetical protein
MEYFYKHAHLSELFLIYDALLLAQGERGSRNTTDDCPIGNAIGASMGIEWPITDQKKVA